MPPAVALLCRAPGGVVASLPVTLLSYQGGASMCKGESLCNKARVAVWPTKIHLPVAAADCLRVAVFEEIFPAGSFDRKDRKT